MDDINALLGMGLEDEEELRALADSLRGRKRAADWFAATTVIPLREAANREQSSIAEAAAQGGVLKKALEERRSREKESDLDRASREKIAELDRDARQRYANSGMPKYVRTMRGPDGKPHTVGMQDGMWIDYTSGIPVDTLEGYTPDPMTEGQTHRATAAIPNEIRSMVKLAQAMNRADEVLKPYEIGGPLERAPKDIPGAGRVSGKPGALGWSMRRLEELQGEDPDRVYSAMEGVRHVLVQESAGLTQTINEMAAQLGISGREFLSNPDVFFEHYDELKRRLNENLATTYASQNPAIQSQLDQQLGENNPFDQKQEPLNLPDIPDQGPVRDMMPGNDAVKRVIQSVRSKPVDEMSDEEVIEEARKKGWRP